MPQPRRLPEPIPEIILTDVAQLKALSDALRLQLVEVMGEDPTRTWTAKELAERLGTKQTKLYHHLALLDEAGIIRVAETRLVSGIQEKRYAVTARSYKVDRSLLTGGGADEGSIAEVLDAMFDRARADIVESVQAGLVSLDQSGPGRRRMALQMTHARLTPAQVRRVMKLIEKLGVIDQEQDPEGADYGLVIGFYPRVDKEKDR
jgi:DNA-binding transcriptional ArsR family regulator